MLVEDYALEPGVSPVKHKFGIVTYPSLVQAVLNASVQWHHCRHNAVMCQPCALLAHFQ